MKPTYNFALFILLSVNILLCICGCNKKFDEPPEYAGPLLKPNLSIRDLRSMHFTGNFEKIPEDFIIGGIVIADDRQDNFYKSIVLQDSTGGITLRLDGFGLYNLFPVGTELFIKLKGLWLGDYAKMVQLGAGVDRSDPNYQELLALPQPLFDRYLVKSGQTLPVNPRTVTLAQLDDSLQSCLLSISSLEFSVSDTGKTFADAVNKQTENRVLKACGGGSIYLRTSGFARFAKLPTPRGNGTLTAVYTVFRTEKQLVIRDTADLHFSGLRCTAQGSKLLFNENFNLAEPNKELVLTGWKNMSESGGQLFFGRKSENNQYAEISGYGTNQPGLVSWLILPPINLTGTVNQVLSFSTRDGFDNGAVLQVLISTNYDGGNAPWKAKWTSLKPVIAKGNVASQAKDWVFSGKTSLASFKGTVYIAFKYEGADSGGVFDKRTTTFQIDDVRIEGN